MHALVPRPETPHGRLEVADDDDLLVFTVPKVTSPWRHRSDDTVPELDDRPPSPARLVPLPYRPVPRRASPTRKANHIPPLRDAPPPPTSDSEPMLAKLIPILGDHVGDVYAHVEAIHAAHVRKLHDERRSPSCVLTFNEQAAVQPELLRARHDEWRLLREQREEDCVINRERRLQEYSDHVEAQTTAYRREVRARAKHHTLLQASLRQVLAPLLVAAAAQFILRGVKMRWAAAALQATVRRCARHWRHLTQQHLALSNAATMLQLWLRESVKIKTVALKVFYGLRIFTRKVTLVQTFWRQHVAITAYRRRKLLRMWSDFELVEPPPVVLPEPEIAQKRDKKPPGGRRRSKKPEVPEETKRPYPTLPYPYPKFEIALRLAIIDQVLAEYQVSLRRRFRALEEDFYPYLLECLQGLEKDAPRSRVREKAQRYRLLGAVHAQLTRMPGALDAQASDGYAQLTLAASIDMCAMLHRANERLNPALYINTVGPNDPPPINRRGSSKRLSIG
ncbi:hypothetical protein SDRG_15770 [Saprolegnia diclina VS20]|uniref:Uncharacterized protein n=1 Tax=Saprolegnia diclina (strain VS20) TaxID=1156394 RepID=T0PZB9_SAPDV|nr:hypothetical protein SDRG_15770 [Saprolegnia diclina VS20]EQC26425.1 hypothetical protein SDRG_15770 [Saprolegnia diclina VS20]|eukprot:XP_008620174.1 hypothetical protein SDRG_15770 [Saprolegnia diclina VS20]